MASFQFLLLDLSLFDGAGASGGDGGGAGDGSAPSGDTGPGNTGETTSNPAAEGAPQEAPPAPPVDRNKAFRDMIDGEYKEQYTKETQRMIDKRFRETKSMEKTMADHKPILDLLAERYGEDDPGKLLQVLSADKTYEQEAAENAGVTVEQWRERNRLIRQAKEYEAMKNRSIAQQRAQEQYNKWGQEAEALKQVYPDFNLAEEVKNPSLTKMLERGIPMKHAYEVLHLDDIKAQTAAATEKRVTDGIKAKGARPDENGTSATGGGTPKTDVSKLTKKQRADIAQKALRGQSVTL